MAVISRAFIGWVGVLWPLAATPDLAASRAARLALVSGPGPPYHESPRASVCLMPCSVLILSQSGDRPRR